MTEKISKRILIILRYIGIGIGGICALAAVTSPIWLHYHERSQHKQMAKNLVKANYCENIKSVKRAGDLVFVKGCGKYWVYKCEIHKTCKEIKKKKKGKK